MRKHEGGTEVPGGFYIERESWHLVTVEGKSGVLPGGATESYRRLPVLALLFAAPLLGALFVMFLPFIGFAMLFEQVGLRVAAAFRRVLHRGPVATEPAAKS